jgi:CheY-like chemotaxis protein
MFAQQLNPRTTSDGRDSADAPRILVAVADANHREALVAALRDTGYEVVETETDESSACAPVPPDFDLVIADTARDQDDSVPTLFVPEPFDVVQVEMLVLDLLGWDGPPTLRRVPTMMLDS